MGVNLAQYKTIAFALNAENGGTTEDPAVNFVAHRHEILFCPGIQLRLATKFA
jgi:hypothetical protein